MNDKVMNQPLERGAIGHHFMLGFDGTWPSEDFVRFLQDEQIAGVILFARNLESREQIQELIRFLKESVGARRKTPLLVGVDHEGGRVFRLPPPFTPLPPAREFGRYFERTQDLKLIEEIAALIGAELREVGFNLNFAPVLDVDSCPLNPIIGDRSFHQDPRIVAAVGKAFVRGFGNAGLISCGKHFPGHGDTCEDSHKTLPEVGQARAMIEQRELLPFKGAITASIPTLMTAHVRYPQLDPGCCGTLSSIINKGLLRDVLGFTGVLFSDDLLMKGIEDPVPEAAERALRASCDILLLCSELDVQRATISHLRRRIEEDPELRRELEASQARIRTLQDLAHSYESQGVPVSKDPSPLPEKLRLIVGES